MQSLDKKLALVTGASSGIGAATARALAGAGARLVLAARRRELLEELAAELGGAQVLELDVRDAQAVKDALASHPIDILVASAGLARGSDLLQDGKVEDWSAMIDTNVKGVLHVLHAALPGMIERGGGDIVTMGSVAGRQVYPRGNVYCASKYAVRAIYEGLRVDLVGKNIRITTVDPGMVKTNFSNVRFDGDQEKAAAVYAGVDYLTAEDVADAVLYAVTRPPHVNIGEIVMWASAQASTTSVHRRAAGDAGN